MSFARDNLRGQKSLDPLKMSLEMAHKVIVPQKKNYVPQFLKQREINSYNGTGFVDKFPTMLLLIWTEHLQLCFEGDHSCLSSITKTKESHSRRKITTSSVGFI